MPVVAKTRGSSASISEAAPLGVSVKREKQRDGVFLRIPELPSSIKFHPCTPIPRVRVHSSIKASRFHFIDQAYFFFASFPTCSLFSFSALHVASLLKIKIRSLPQGPPVAFV